MKDIVTVDEAAAFLRKHPDTIRRWIEGKKLKARKLSAGGNGIYAILRNDLLEYTLTLSMQEQKKQPRKKKQSPDQRTLPL